MHACAHMCVLEDRERGLKSGGLCVIWHGLVGEDWRIPEGQVVSLLPLSSLSLGCSYLFLEGRSGGSRLGKFITQLIHLDQTGFLLGRCSADGMRKLQHLPVLATDRGCQEVGKLLVRPTRFPWAYVNEPFSFSPCDSLPAAPQSPFMGKHLVL